MNFHDLKNPFYLGRIVGKRLNVCMDIKSGLLSEEAVANIKLLTGETWLEAEKKYENPRTVFTSCKFIWGSNHPLKVAVPDSAFWNRVIFLPFMFACPEDQKNLNLLQDLYQNAMASLQNPPWQPMLSFREIWFLHHQQPLIPSYPSGHLMTTRSTASSTIAVRSLILRTILSPCGTYITAFRSIPAMLKCLYNFFPKKSPPLWPPAARK